MNLSYKMYGIVANNLTSLQKGIQFGKAIIKYGKEYDSDVYKKWVEGDMDTVILCGGSTNSRRFNGNYIGTMNRHLESLRSNGVKHTKEYYDNDLGDQLTAITFMVDDRVWDIEKYPDYSGPWIDSNKKNPFEIPYNHWISKFGDDEERKTIFFLRKFLKELKEL